MARCDADEENERHAERNSEKTHFAQHHAEHRDQREHDDGLNGRMLGKRSVNQSILFRSGIVPAAKIAVFSEWRCADASFCRIAGMNGPNILIARDGRIRRIISGERVYGALSGSALFAFSE